MIANLNLGKVTENDFKESDSVAIAKEVIQQNRKIKTYFNEMDKRANLDGSMAIINNGYEVTMIDVQIKTLPFNYLTNKKYDKYYYDCDTKIFNVVRLNLTLNPVVLILVDRFEKKVFYILLTRQYVSSLKINTQKTKRIFFNDEDEFNDDKLIGKIYEYNKVITSDVSMQVFVEQIRKEIKRKRKIHHKNDSLDYYRLVYERKNVRGYLSNFIWNGNKPITICLLYMHDVLNDKKEYIQLFMEKTLIHLNRSVQRISATDSDIVNILYEIALFTEKEILFKSEGIPIYLISRTSLQGNIWRLRAEEIEKDW